jgi:putative transposase
MKRTYLYRLYPSKSQRGRLEAVRETCRHFYNDCRRERKEAYEERGETISKTVQLRKVKVEKATSPYALDIHSHILQNVAADLDKAFEAFFRRVKAGENPGYPRFKVRNRFAGFGFKEYGNGFKAGPRQDAGEGRRLKLSGIGRIAVRWHRKLEGTIKTARVFCRAGKWFVAFSCEVEKPEPLPKTGESIGIDLGLMRLATFSTGEKKENPRWYRGILRELRVLQRKIARCVMGSRNRRRLIGRLQRMMVHVANARKDFLNKFVHELVARFDRIVLEDLRVAALPSILLWALPGRFAKSILDAGWSYLVSHLAHKAESAGREIAKVDPAYTSKTCSGCGVRFEHLSLWDRWIECGCGVSLDRDHNAAINILQKGGNEPLGAKLGNGRVCPEAAPL